MSTTAITALKNEITRLEQDLDQHRRALQVLEGGGATQKPALPARPAPQKAMSAKPAPQKAMKVLIQEALKARAPAKLTPSEIVQQLAQQGHGTKLKNIHARLSEMVKVKAINRQAGRYWVQQKK